MLRASIVAAVILLALSKPAAHLSVPINRTAPAVTTTRPTAPSSIIDTQEERWQRAVVRPEKVHFVQAIAAQIERSRPRYENVSATTHVPWQVIASLHNMECGLNFKQNLANGDSIFYKTRHVPAGRPPGPPPFTWEQCAIDALRFDHLERAYWNSRGWLLQNIERYNGTGYQRWHRDVPSPYLWSWTTISKPGKYIEDGQWSSTAISQQCGVVPILKMLP